MVAPSTGRETRVGVRGLPTTPDCKIYQLLLSSRIQRSAQLGDEVRLVYVYCLFYHCRALRGLCSFLVLKVEQMYTGRLRRSTH